MKLEGLRVFLAVWLALLCQESFAPVPDPLHTQCMLILGGRYNTILSTEPGTTGDTWDQMPEGIIADRMASQFAGQGLPLAEEWAKAAGYRDVLMGAASGNLHDLASRHLYQRAIRNSRNPLIVEIRRSYAEKYANATLHPVDLSMGDRIVVFREMARNWYDPDESAAALAVYRAEYTRERDAYIARAVAAAEAGGPFTEKFQPPYTYQLLRPNNDRMRREREALPYADLPLESRQEICRILGLPRPS